MRTSELRCMYQNYTFTVLIAVIKYCICCQSRYTQLKLKKKKSAQVSSCSKLWERYSSLYQGCPTPVILQKKKKKILTRMLVFVKTSRLPVSGMQVTMVKISWNAWKFLGKVFFPILLYRAKFPEINEFLRSFPEIRKSPENLQPWTFRKIVWKTIYLIGHGFFGFCLGKTLLEILKAINQKLIGVLPFD